MKTLEQLFAYHGIAPTRAEFDLIAEKLENINFMYFDELFEKCTHLTKITPKTVIEEALIINADKYTHRPLIGPVCTFNDDFKRFYGAGVLEVCKKKKEEMGLGSLQKTFYQLLKDLKNNGKICGCSKCF